MPFPSYPTRTRENPYTDLLYRHLVDAGVRVLPDDRIWFRAFLGRPDVPPDFVHYHWPGRRYTSRVGPLSPARAAWFFGRLDLMRLRGVQIVWTMHNELPHERAWDAFDGWARRRMVATSDLILVNFLAAADLLRERYGRTAGVYHVPHGSYRGHYPDELGRAAARARLGIAGDAFVFLAFGDIRAYKSIADAIEAFRHIDAPSARLLIAGRPKSREAVREAVRMVKSDARILVHARAVRDEEVQVYFRTADALLIGRRAFSSGAAVLGLDFGLPIVGFAENHVGEIARGAALIPIEEEGRAGFSRAMRAALAMDVEVARRDAVASSDALAWPPIAARLAEILRENLRRGSE
jgi:phosphohistidine swiveling domain-containing protein